MFSSKNGPHFSVKCVCVSVCLLISGVPAVCFVFGFLFFIFFPLAVEMKCDGGCNLNMMTDTLFLFQFFAILYFFQLLFIKQPLAFTVEKQPAFCLFRAGRGKWKGKSENSWETFVNCNDELFSSLDFHFTFDDGGAFFHAVFFLLCQFKTRFFEALQSSLCHTQTVVFVAFELGF